MQVNLHAIKKDESLNEYKIIVLQASLFMLGVLVVVLAKTRWIFVFSDCFLKNNLGIPCPGCGATRCVVSLCDFNLLEAFKYHPVWFLAVFYMLFVEIIYVINTIFNKKYLVKLYSSLAPLYVFLLLFIAQWILRIICILNGIELPFMYVYV